MSELTQAFASLGLDPRFRPIRELGQGSAARVFEVYDTLGDAQRALKIAHGSRQRRRMRQEYQRFAELRHPNIVRVYDFGETSLGLPYYTMELVRGVPFSELEARADPRVLVAVAAQVLDALTTLHARGWVHRDVKPGNLMTLGEGSAVLVRLIDLGLLAPIGASARPSGTIVYMAPEVARREALDGRADLYSLGVLLYEGLVGDTFATQLEDVAQRLRERPTPPADFVPGLPAGLSDFIMRLLAPDPNDRFASAGAAGEVLASLVADGSSDVSQRVRADRLLRGGAVSHRARIVRRVRSAAREALQQGHGWVGAIEAATGLGKTPLMRELGMRLNLDGLRVLHVAVTRAPSSPVPRLLRLLASLEPQHPLVHAAARAPDANDGEAGPPRGLADRVGRALAAALKSQPTALLLDDAHLAEPVGLAAIRTLCDEADGQALLIVAASEAQSAHAGFVAALSPMVQHIVLPPLAPAEVIVLGTHRLHGLKIPGLVARRLADDSRGMPSLVERTLARLLVDGVIARSGDCYAFVGGRYRGVQYGDRDQVRSRLEDVPVQYLQVLRAAAVLGRALSASTVAEVAGCSYNAAAQGLAALASQGVLHAGEAVEEPGFRFVSRRLLASCYHEIPLDERRRLHDRAAQASGERARDSGRLEDRVEHLLRGSDVDAAVHAAVEAAERASHVRADRRAIEYYARAYARLPAPTDARAAPIALALARLFEYGGELERAAVWYQAVKSAADGRTGELAAQVELGLGTLALLSGELAEAAAHADAAIDMLTDEPFVASKIEAARLRALVHSQRGEGELAEVQLLEALGRAEAEGFAGLALRLLLDVSLVATRRAQFVRAARFAREAQRRARERHDAHGVAEATGVLARGFIRAGRSRAARRALLAAQQAARAAGDRLLEAAVRRQMGNLSLRVGDLLDAIEHYERSLELVRAVGVRAEESICLHHIDAVRLLLGQYASAVRALEEASRAARASGDVLSEAASILELAVGAAQVGDHAGAEALLAKVQPLAERLDNPTVAAKVPALHATLAQIRGDLAPARVLLERVAQLLSPLEDPSDRAFLLRHAGQLALVLGSTREASELATRLSEEVDRGALAHLWPSALALRAQVDDETDAGEDAVARVREAASRARELGLVPLEIELRTWLGVAQSGSDASIEELTLAMERSRELVRALPSDTQRAYLAAPAMSRLRAAFGDEVARLGIGGSPRHVRGRRRPQQGRAVQDKNNPNDIRQQEMGKLQRDGREQ